MTLDIGLLAKLFREYRERATQTPTGTLGVPRPRVTEIGGAVVAITPIAVMDDYGDPAHAIDDATARANAGFISLCFNRVMELVVWAETHQIGTSEIVDHWSAQLDRLNNTQRAVLLRNAKLNRELKAARRDKDHWQGVAWALRHYIAGLPTNETESRMALYVRKHRLWMDEDGDCRECGAKVYHHGERHMNANHNQSLDPCPFAQFGDPRKDRYHP